jgi:predicted dehydrogenase
MSRQVSVKPVRIGFIGAGIVSDLHADGIRACPAAELAGLWTRNPEHAAAKSAAFGCPAYPSPEALVADPGIDAVAVLTNLETHLEYALLALRAGKHVLVEKPVASTVGQLEELQAATRAAGRLCMPGHNYIYEPGLIRCQGLLASGRLGRLVSLYVLYNIHHPESVAALYPGVIRQIMTHHAYIVLFLAGRPVCLSAMKAVLHYARLTQEDLAMVNLRLRDGALAHCCASFAADDHTADPWTVLVKVIGTEGAARFTYRDWVENRPGAVHAQTYSAYPGSIAAEIEHFVRCVRGEASPLSTLEDALDAQRIVQACEVAADGGETVTLSY